MSEGGKRDRELAASHGLLIPDRWERGTPHHPMSRRLVEFLTEHDSADYGSYFDWRTGGDGDNGETLMYEVDAFFELLDKLGEGGQSRRQRAAADFAAGLGWGELVLLSEALLCYREETGSARVAHDVGVLHDKLQVVLDVEEDGEEVGRGRR